MGTRSTIQIEGFKLAKVYKHWGGDPDSMLPWLKSFNKEFQENRGDDPSYKFAQLLRSSDRVSVEFSLDDSIYTGWGAVDLGDECGAEYEYTLHIDGTVSYK